MKYILYIVLLCVLCGCGVFRKVHKESVSDKLESYSYVKYDSSDVKIDRSVIVTKETADTSVTTPSKIVTQKVNFNIDSLITGMTAVKNDLVGIRLMLDPVTQTLTTIATVNSQVIPFRIDRETVRVNDITQSGSLSKSTEQSRKEEHKANSVDKDPKNSIWFILMVLGSVAIVGYLIYRYYKV